MFFITIIKKQTRKTTTNNPVSNKAQSLIQAERGLQVNRGGVDEVWREASWGIELGTRFLVLNASTVLCHLRPQYYIPMGLPDEESLIRSPWQLLA